MATAKTIEQLSEAKQINATDQMAFAQENGKEAVRGSVQMLAGAVADINETGALAELAYATSQGKNLLAQNLTAKGVPTQANETLIQMADKVNNLSVEQGADKLLGTWIEQEKYTTYACAFDDSPAGYIAYIYNNVLYVNQKDTAASGTLSFTDYRNNAKASIQLNTPVPGGSYGWGWVTISRNARYIVVGSSDTVRFYEFLAEEGTLSLLEEKTFVQAEDGVKMHGGSYGKYATAVAISDNGNVLFFRGVKKDGNTQSLCFWDRQAQSGGTFSLSGNDLPLGGCFIDEQNRLFFIDEQSKVARLQLAEDLHSFTQQARCSASFNTAYRGWVDKENKIFIFQSYSASTVELDKPKGVALSKYRIVNAEQENMTDVVFQLQVAARNNSSSINISENFSYLPVFGEKSGDLIKYKFLYGTEDAVISFDRSNNTVEVSAEAIVLSNLINDDNNGTGAFLLPFPFALYEDQQHVFISGFIGNSFENRSTYKAIPWVEIKLRKKQILVQKRLINGEYIFFWPSKPVSPVTVAEGYFDAQSSVQPATPEEA